MFSRREQDDIRKVIDEREALRALLRSLGEME